jgi:hypothetical protein
MLAVNPVFQDKVNPARVPMVPQAHSSAISQVTVTIPASAKASIGLMVALVVFLEATSRVNVKMDSGAAKPVLKMVTLLDNACALLWPMAALPTAHQVIAMPVSVTMENRAHKFVMKPVTLMVHALVSR